MMTKKSMYPKTYSTVEDRVRAVYNMLKKYHKYKGIKLNPAKVLHDPDISVESFVLDTMRYDTEFHRFVLKNYGIKIRFDKENENGFLILNIYLIIKVS